MRGVCYHHHLSCFFELVRYQHGALEIQCAGEKWANDVDNIICMDVVAIFRDQFPGFALVPMGIVGRLGSMVADASISGNAGVSSSATTSVDQAVPTNISSTASLQIFGQNSVPRPMLKCDLQAQQKGAQVLADIRAAKGNHLRYPVIKLGA